MLHKVVINANHLREALANVRGAVMICYPMGLPDCDPVHQLLSGTFKGQQMHILYIYVSCFDCFGKGKILELLFCPLCYLIFFIKSKCELFF